MCEIIHPVSQGTVKLVFPSLLLPWGYYEVLQIQFKDYRSDRWPSRQSRLRLQAFSPFWMAWRGTRTCEPMSLL